MNIHIPNCRWRRIHPESEIINVCLVILGPQKTVIGRPDRWDPQSKQKASNRKCRQKEVKREKKYRGNDTQGKGEIFRFRHEATSFSVTRHSISMATMATDYKLHLLRWFPSHLGLPEGKSNCCFCIPSIPIHRIHGAGIYSNIKGVY